MSDNFVLNQGVRIWTSIQGNGIPMILCNGGPGYCDYLAPVASLIDDLAQVIRFEQRGCGLSDKQGPYDLRTCISDLESIRNHYGIDKWIVGGHSWGANLSLAYAIEKPQNLLALIYIAGNGAQHDIDWQTAYQIALLEHGEQTPEMNYPGNNEVNQKCSGSWYEYIKQPDFLKKVSEIDVPSLFVFGNLDIRPNWPAEQIANLIRGCNQAHIDGAAHYIWLTHSKELREILRNFIKDRL